MKALHGCLVLRNQKYLEQMRVLHLAITNMWTSLMLWLSRWNLIHLLRGTNLTKIRKLSSSKNLTTTTCTTFTEVLGMTESLRQWRAVNTMTKSPSLQKMHGTQLPRKRNSLQTKSVVNWIKMRQKTLETLPMRKKLQELNEKN